MVEIGGVQCLLRGHVIDGAQDSLVLFAYFAVCLFLARQPGKAHIQDFYHALRVDD